VGLVWGGTERCCDVLSEFMGSVSCGRALRIVVRQGALSRNRSMTLHVPERSTAIYLPFFVFPQSYFVASYIAVGVSGRGIVVVTRRMLRRVRRNRAIALRPKPPPPSKPLLNLGIM
jgi:hypothetical protein